MYVVVPARHVTLIGEHLKIRVNLPSEQLLLVLGRLEFERVEPDCGRLN